MPGGIFRVHCILYRHIPHLLLCKMGLSGIVSNVGLLLPDRELLVRAMYFHRYVHITRVRGSYNDFTVS